MLNEYMEQIEAASLWFFLSVLFFLIGMAIQDVLKKAMYQNLVGFSSGLYYFWVAPAFLAKGVIQFIYESQGLG